MSRLIARYSCLGTKAKWFCGLIFCLIAFLLVVGFGASNDLLPMVAEANALTESSAATGNDFRLLSPPVSQHNGAWRVTWTSTSGKTYQLQRAANDELGATDCLGVATVAAAGPVTFFDDFTTAQRRFYRVKLIETVTTPFQIGAQEFFVPL